MTGKILGIGLQRTGTTSLYHALKELDYRAAPDSIALFYDLDASLLQQYDAFMDNPIPLVYQQIDQQIDDCKFILTTRSKESWLKSVEWLFTHELPKLNSNLQQTASAIHQVFYGIDQFNEQVFSKRWEDYHDEVHAYFKGREHDLLIMNLENGDGWETLCAFLNKKQPKRPFPHANEAQ